MPCRPTLWPLGAAVQLGELACSSTFALAPSGGVITANAIIKDSAADATGTASFFACSRAAAPKWQGTCGGTAQSTVGDLQLNSTAIVVGGPIAVTALALTMPGRDAMAITTLDGDCGLKAKPAQFSRLAPRDGGRHLVQPV